MSFLKWNEKKKNILLNKVFGNKKGIIFGSSCMFIKLNATEGLKIYSCKELRDYSWKLQNRAYKYDLAPKTGDRFCFNTVWFDEDSYMDEDPFKFTRFYGYMTEVVRLIRIDADSQEIAINLGQELKKCAINHEDLHYRNIGIMNKKYVCIDFDPHSCSVI